MNTINDFVSKYNISELDLYVLSKFEADKSFANFIEKDVIRAKQVSILKKYKFSIFERKKFLNLLKNNPIHNDVTFQEKYKGSENDIVLNEIGKKAKRNLFIAIAAIVVVFFAVSISNNSNNIKTETSHPTSNIYKCNGVTLEINGNTITSSLGISGTFYTQNGISIFTFSDGSRAEGVFGDNGLVFNGTYFKRQ